MFSWRRVVTAPWPAAALLAPAALVPLLVAVGERDVPHVLAFFAVVLVSALLAGLGHLLAPRTPPLRDRDAALAIALSWLILPAIAAMPFWMTGTLGPLDAWFESMSGATTTGATVLHGQLDDLSLSMLVWRALLQGLGGFATVVLFVAVLARFTIGPEVILRMEATSATTGHLKPALMHAMRTVGVLYGAMTAILAALLALVLMAQGMDATTAAWQGALHALTTVSSGGFLHADGGLPFDLSGHVLLAIAMALAGTSFAWQHQLFHRVGTALRDPEWRAYVIGLAASVALLTALLAATGQDIVAALREASFVTVALGSSTGYGAHLAADWPASAKLIALAWVLVGASVGSTAGGMKLLRMVLLVKIVRREVRRLLHPRAVIPIRVGTTTVRDDSLFTLVAFFFSFVTAWMLGTIFFITAEPDLDLFSGIMVSASSLGNVGPAIGVVGIDGHDVLSTPSRVVAAVLMWCGRLEMFAALLLLRPGSWRS